MRVRRIPSPQGIADIFAQCVNQKLILRIKLDAILMIAVLGPNLESVSAKSRAKVDS
jgi:hypothetical protein